ncbi:hypothetical protein K2173_012354 [Erythroxylum novogranatense]|uniref:RRM domain-containing protein n=1 Tax=Erythroxylum novogranatense TaxID=1862640 RepID=A0AAV8U9S2_9ROSI|nr:hypothetical protein K2173_012354 [Erythroxylum novogranatense]
MGSVEERTFKVNFSADGVAQLRDRVMDKLKEFMGDYTDHTLVEYVIVLLRNGRRKDEAKNELDVFLGDDSESFVSWLWDHLASNLDEYIHPLESNRDETLKTKATVEDQSGKSESQSMDFKLEKGKSDTLSRKRHKKDWKGLLRDRSEQQPLWNHDFGNSHIEAKSRYKVNQTERSASPPPTEHRKRRRHEERQFIKREEVSQATINAPRRLLQFAVRDAVGTLKSPGSAKKSPVKRLRSVVSTSADESSLVDHPRRISSIARVPNALATVTKAVQEAAEDVMKSKPKGSVFDRLGHTADVLETFELVDGLREGSIDDEEYEELHDISEDTFLNYSQRGEYVGNVGEKNIRGSGTSLTSDSFSDNEGYDDDNAIGHRLTNISQMVAYGGNTNENSVILHHGANKKLPDGLQVSQNKNQSQLSSAVSTSGKLVNISADVNSWRQPRYMELRRVADLDNQNSSLGAEAELGKSGTRLLKGNNDPVMIRNGNVKIATGTEAESQKILPSVPGSLTAGRPLEVAESRTIFVSNVNFAATKDGLSRHFNKFGEVLKVVIVTDAATGQPKGSAYVEFMRKEAADNALSLDGTSFMSRILKIVKRSSTNQEATPPMTWPRVARGSPFVAARFSRVPFPRGMSGQFRPRLPLKPGARSLQWKRDAKPTTAGSGSSGSVNNIIFPTTRSLTYVRTEPKPDMNSGTA